MPPIDSLMARLLDRWEDARAREIVLTPEQLCEDCPDRLDEARRHIADLQRIGRMPPLDRPQPIEIETVRPTANAAESVRALPLSVESRYHSLEFLAKGGLGAVYRAGDELLHRHVALKFIHPDKARDEETRMRFLVEAEVTGRLEHPGVVPVHGIGRDSTGCPFYVMRLIQGQTLDEAISEYHRPGRDGRRKRIGFRQLVTRFVSVCRTLDYAHNRGIGHQDVKPENIMLGRYGETLVLDWGLARTIGRSRKAKDSGEHTLMPRSLNGSGSTSGSGGGTPQYMSPEQARALRPLLDQSGGAAGAFVEAPPATVRSDVYSLGATFYKLLTGVAPFTGRTQDILKQVEAGRFAAPRAVRPDVPAPLNSICLKAMALDPEQRHETAAQLAEDLEHWLADEKVDSHAETIVARTGRWFRRHRLAALVGVAALALLLLANFFAALRQKDLADKADQARQAAVALREKGLVQTARFAALNLENEIDDMLGKMELEATHPKLIASLSALARSETMDDEERSGTEKTEAAAGLQSWIDRLNDRWRDSIKVRSWLLTDTRGVQVARNPVDESTRWKDFSWRDYFHGRGSDLSADAARANPPGPLARPHVSRVFLSKSDEKGLVVALSVPVRENHDRTGAGPVIGVLVLSIACNEFHALRTAPESDEVAILVDARDDVVETESRSGLVLHHGRLADGERQGSRPGASRKSGSNHSILRVRKELQDDVAKSADGLLRNFVDPIDRSELPVTAAFEPVKLPTASDQAMPDSGLQWLVILKHAGPAAPAAR